MKAKFAACEANIPYAAVRIKNTAIGRPIAVLSVKFYSFS